MFSCMTNALLMKQPSLFPYTFPVRYSLVFPFSLSLLLVVHAWSVCNCEPHAWLHWETSEAVSWRVGWGGGKHQRESLVYGMILLAAMAPVCLGEGQMSQSCQPENVLISLVIVLPHRGRRRIGRSLWCCDNRSHMAAQAWCLTKPPSFGYVSRGVVIWGGEQEGEAGKHNTADGVMRHSFGSALG